MAQRKRGETLRDLVNRLLHDRGMSGRGFAREASKRGYTVSYTTINLLRNGQRVGFTDDTLAAIADVLNVPEAQVRAAANVPARDDATDPELLALHQTLTPHEREAALRMYREYVRSIRGMRQPK